MNHVIDVFSLTNRETYIDKPYFGYEGMINMMEVIANYWEGNELFVLNISTELRQRAIAL
ncbi:hypothetical protein NSMS1_25720 [Nostoc sp. MS1]|nr:hypothetical protein NSMS1_25720 [Nostoc sp. MS1]